MYVIKSFRMYFTHNSIGGKVCNELSLKESEKAFKAVDCFKVNLLMSRSVGSIQTKLCLP